VDIVVKGRHLDLSERFREHVVDKLAKVDRLDAGLQRIDVEVSKETNPRLADRAFRVELTCRSRGPVIRAEAATDDKYGALDVAYAKLESRLRRNADRRSNWNRHEKAAAADGAKLAAVPDLAEPDDQWSVPETGPMVVREKSHPASPMTLDQALYEMELVGHDFFLFVNSANGRPSVVYRRKAYDYGVICLELEAAG
jgi:ribosomal subunit interface protein